MVSVDGHKLIDFIKSHEHGPILTRIANLCHERVAVFPAVYVELRHIL
jgi:hypothetical protein